MAKLYKKDEETCLNKKKKREEVKQKNKNEKTRVNNRNGNQNGYNQYTNFYQGFYLPPPMQPMNNQNTPMDYQYYYFNNPYQLPPHLYAFPQYMQGTSHSPSRPPQSGSARPPQGSSSRPRRRPGSRCPRCCGKCCALP